MRVINGAIGLPLIINIPGPSSAAQSSTSPVFGQASSAKQRHSCVTHVWKGLIPCDTVKTLGHKSHKNYEIHIDVSHSRQPLVKGERLVRYEVNTVMLVHAICWSVLLGDGWAVPLLSCIHCWCGAPQTICRRSH